jgi:hypothetical protein
MMRRFFAFLWVLRRLGGGGYNPCLPDDWVPSDRLRRSEDRTPRQLRG